MASPKISKDIRTYLVNTVGLSDVSVARLTASPINQYAVVEYAGGATTKTHGGGSPQLDNARVQIMCRDANAQTAMNNIHAVKDALDGLKDVTIGSVVYLYFSEVSRPRLLDVQEDGSVIYIWEFQVQARR